jgi:transcriptional regulator with GAF, ATPase, and Fis domain
MNSSAMSGAFTGAAATQAGLVEQADGGCLFLDEIGCLPLQAQVKLLRFLQSHEFRPLGAGKARTSDVRIIAATNTDMERALRDGNFRADLYYRLNVIPIVLPPLRERREDIPLLANFFARKLP